MPTKYLSPSLNILAIICASAPVLAGGTYTFTVTCSDAAHVVKWRTGDIDPGEEFLRVSTGTANPGCSITDFNPQTDGSLPVSVKSHEGAILEGIPLLKAIVCYFYCPEGW